MCGSHSLYYGSRIDLTQPRIPPEILRSLRGWSIAGFSVTVAGNIYCLGTSNKGLSEPEHSNPTSALISFFIWRAHRGIRRTTPTGLQVRAFVWSCKNDANLFHSQSVLQIIIESAGIWVFFISLTFIIFLFNETACYIFLYLVRPRLHVQIVALSSSPPRYRPPLSLGYVSAR